MPPQFTDYERADFQTLYQREHWHTWDEEIKWLRTDGQGDRDIEPDEALHMAADIQLLRDDDIRFTDDPKQAFRLAKAHCNHERQNGGS
jgi:hypothetical protein